MIEHHTPFGKPIVKKVRKRTVRAERTNAAEAAKVKEEAARHSFVLVAAG